AEHHFQREGYECIPNILMLALHLCHITKNIKIGCGFNIAPMWHPLRMAEDYATADWLTGGRVIFGVGRGYHTREVEVVRAPLRKAAPTRRSCTRSARRVPAPGGKPSWAATSASAFRSTSPTASSKASRRRRRSSRRTSRCSRRSASYRA